MVLNSALAYTYYSVIFSLWKVLPEFGRLTKVSNKIFLLTLKLSKILSKILSFVAYFIIFLNSSLENHDINNVNSNIIFESMNRVETKVFNRY